MAINRIFTVLLASLFFFNLWAQVNPAAHPVFSQQIVHRIDVSIHPDSLAWLFKSENLYKNDYKRTNFIFTHGVSGTQFNINQVGFRLRGNTSRQAEKKSFKIQFDEFVPNQALLGLDELNLKGSHNDPSLMREVLSYQIFRAMDVPAPRTGFVELYINNSYFGLYVNVEHIDRRFAEARFNNKNGNLYKCNYGANLEVHADAYDNAIYELKTNEDLNNRQHLEQLIDVLNFSTAGTFRNDILQIINVPALMRYFAVETLVGHWDGYSYNKNNFYLYFNTLTHKFEFIPYDPDNTFGIDWVGPDWGTRNIYNWEKENSARPLNERLLGLREFKIMYTQYLNECIEKYFNSTYLFPKIDSIQSLLRPYLINDPLYPLDYGFNINSFNLSVSQSLGNHLEYGIKPYIAQRQNSANQQIDRVALYVEYAQEQTGLKIFATQKGVEILNNNFSDEMHCLVYSLSGRLIENRILKNTHEYFMLPAGVYIISIPNQNIHQKVVVM